VPASSSKYTAAAAFASVAAAAQQMRRGDEQEVSDITMALPSNGVSSLAWVACVLTCCRAQHCSSLLLIRNNALCSSRSALFTPPPSPSPSPAHTQAEYEAEGIDWSYIEFVDNQDVLDLIEGKLGIVDLLDEQCRFPSSTPRVSGRQSSS
jgi:hypothetical protein